MRNLDPRRRLQFVTGDDGTWLYRDDLNLDTKVRQLQFDLAGDMFQGLFRHLMDIELGFIQQGQRWQFGITIGGKQWHLTFALGPLTDHRLFGYRLFNYRGHALFGFDLLPLGLDLESRLTFTALATGNEPLLDPGITLANH